MCGNLVNILNKCANECCGNIIHDRKKVTFNWSDDLKKLKQQSINIYNLWKLCGKPHYGVIYQERLRVKSKYKQCIKDHKRQYEHRKQEWLEYKFVSGNSKGLWRGYRSLMDGSKNDMTSCNISGITNNGDICESFKRVFESNFCNSWLNGWACLKLNDLIGKVKAEFIEAESTIFTVQEITDAIGLLKVGKAAGCDHLSAEAVKYAHPLIIWVLQHLFNMCCKRGCVPLNFCIVRIVPVLNKCNVCVSSNDFRPVTTVSVIAKIFKYCLINKLSNYMNILELQFEFTKSGGWDKALLVFKTVVEYYNNYRSTVFVAALNFTKACDRLNQCI